MPAWNGGAHYLTATSPGSVTVASAGATTYTLTTGEFTLVPGRDYTLGAPIVWTRAPTASIASGTMYYEPFQAVAPTPGQLAARAQWEATNAHRRAARVKATDRAVAALLGFLTADQRASYERDQSFLVVGSAGGVYRIRPGTAGNVDWLEPGVTDRAAGVLCAHPDLWTNKGRLPDPDVALAQLLALTTDEPGFVRVANVHQGQRPAHILR